MAPTKSKSKGKSKSSDVTLTRSEKSSSARDGIHGFSRSSGILIHVQEGAASKLAPRGSSVDGELHIFGSVVPDFAKLQAEILHDVVDHWQKSIIDNKSLDSIFLQTRRAPVWIFRPRQLMQPAKKSHDEAHASHHYGLLKQSEYALMRDRVGGIWQSFKDLQGVKHMGVFFHGCTDDEILGALTGMEIASYRFTHVVKGRAAQPHFKITAFGVNKKQIAEAKSIGESVNLARHLVNLDAAKINPATYSEFVDNWFADSSNMTVEIWGPDRLLKEKMHLHYGVGQGAAQKSHMVLLKYRPKGKHRFKRSLAFVGKGVTFDTGGLDIKPAAGMRLMKKDMGGSATVVGIANWLVQTNSDVPCDLYLALAENAVDQHSFKPGDVLVSRSGLSVEIHNTDAEGRLVMADVMDVATSQSDHDKPLALLDFSTLTGAMRVAVGTEIAGMFANHDGLGDLALQSGAKAGDPAWRLPLWDNYKTQLRSSFADLANASDSGFGGAISAALFLQRFVKGAVPWVHFDLYCWTDRATGACADAGGTGQGVQLAIHLLNHISAETFSL